MNNGACVQVRFAAGTVQIRDSKDPDGPVLSTTNLDWAALVGAIAAGDIVPCHEARLS